MKTVITFVFLIALVGLPAGLLDASAKDTYAQRGVKKAPVTANQVKPNPATEKSVPAPSTVLLSGAAGGIAVGVRKFWRARS
jgi:hypothetical protein